MEDHLGAAGGRLTGLPADDRPLPSVAVYDDLLGKAST